MAMTATGRRGGFSAVLLRVLPGPSLLKSAWAGTKLVCLLLITVVTLYLATWWAVGGAALLTVLAALAGRVPASAWPSLPTWFWAVTIGGGIGATLGGGLDFFLRSTILSFAVIALSLIATWTTPMAQIPPAVATLLRPLRLFRLPVDEWAVATGLTVRALPPLIDELGVVFDASRLRPRGRQGLGEREKFRLMLRDLGDAIVAVLATSTRRGAETGTAMVARGGVTPLPRTPVRLGWADLCLITVTVAVLAAAILVSQLGWPL